jgi:hypothetical protein
MTDNIEELLEQRAKDYGDPEAFMQQLSGVWSSMLGVNITPNQCVSMMIAFKAIRSCNNPNHLDSFKDAAGYSTIGEKIIVK